MECISPSARVGIQGDDIALAKLLQEQERALWLIAQGGAEVQSQEEPESLDGLSDEELARRLQEQEDNAAYAALYGLPPYGGELDGVVQGDNDDQGAGGEQQQHEQEEGEAEAPMTYEDMLALGELAGNVSKGLPEEVVHRLPVMAVGSLRGTDGGDSAAGALCLDKCCICQLEFEDEDEATPLPCKHCYHSECVRRWLQQSKACPVCSKEVQLTS